MERKTPADFETAISACGFGLFNVFLLVCCMPSLMAMVFSASSMSYILPTAECALKLSLYEKGLLNAVTYVGMILSAMPWGFIADTMGRKVVLVCGGWMDGICVFCAAFSQSSTQLMILKFIDGIIVCGPFAVVVSYLAEFHGKKHRPYVMMFVGLSVSFAAFILPVLAYFLLPLRIAFTFISFDFQTWQVFIGCTALPSLMSGFLLIFLPESPKFLMSQGNYKGALHIFRMIFALNKRKKRDEYPIKNIKDETPDRSSTTPEVRPNSLKARFKRGKEKFVSGVRQLVPMFSSPYLLLSLRIYCLHFCQILCVNSIRLWLPQIFATSRDFELHGKNDTSMCAVLNYNGRSVPKADNEEEEEDKVKDVAECEHMPSEAYQDNITVALIGIIGFVLIFPIIRIPKLRSHILKLGLFLGTCALISLYFSPTPLYSLIFAAIYLTVMGICATTVIGQSVVMFPTLMRTMVVALIMTFGRVGSVCGNVLFPVFIKMGCLPPFIWLGCHMVVAFIFSLFLPSESRHDLQ